MVLQDKNRALGKYYRSRRKKTANRYRKKETDLNVFYIHCSSPCTKTITLQKAHGYLRCITSLKTTQNRKVIEVFNKYLRISLPGTYGRTKCGLSLKSCSSADGKVLHSTHVLLSSIDIKTSRPCCPNLSSWLYFWYVIHDIASSFESPWYLLYLCILFAEQLVAV